MLTIFLTLVTQRFLDILSFYISPSTFLATTFHPAEVFFPYRQCGLVPWTTIER